MSNFRFQDYVTSGAFTLSLARSQVMAMHRIASGSDHYACAATAKHAVHKRRRHQVIGSGV